jgi:anti-sigma regulatory factor (Ser/Thr protein kinase)
MTTDSPEEELTSTPRELHHRVAADATHLAAVRKALAGWAEGIGMSREQRSDFVLAAYEALANAAEHAYVGQTGGVIDLWARCAQGLVTVVVTDYGSWRPPQPSDGLRGRGLLLINALAHHNEVSRDATGTTVTMTWPSPRPR